MSVVVYSGDLSEAPSWEHHLVGEEDPEHQGPP